MAKKKADDGVLVGKNRINAKALMEQVSTLYSQNWYATANQTYRPKLFSVNYNTLEQMADKNPLVNAIINKRCEQIRAFCKVSREPSERGFTIVPRKKTKRPDGDRIQELQECFLATGWIEDDEREDDFADFVQELTRDVLIFDQNATELRRTRKGDVADFWYIDATTIERIAKNTDMYRQGYRYAQKDDRDKYCAFYKTRDLVFDYMNKRARLKYRGYGYSKLEQMIDLVTTFLFSLGYNRDMFVKDKVPKGFLKITGEVDQKTLMALRNHWVAEMSGYGARFGVPIIPSGKDGVGIDWQSLYQTNRDMEYHKLVMFIVALTCAVYSIDPAEIGLRTEESQQLIGDSGEVRIQHSKDSGLGTLLNYIEAYCNKILKEIDPDYVFQFVGVKDEDLAKKEDIIKKRLETRMTIDEVREAEGLEPFNQPWSKLPLNTTILQMAGNPQAGPPGGAPGGEAPPGGEEAQPADEEPAGEGGEPQISDEELEAALNPPEGGEEGALEEEPVEKSRARATRKGRETGYLDIDIR